MIETYLINAVFAIAFAALGYRFSKSRMRMGVDIVVEETIDQLIKKGYLRTRGYGEDLEIVKWNEDEQV